MTSNNQDELDYDYIVEDALRSVVKRSLGIVAKNGLNKDHHFFISFNSDFPGVIVPPELVNPNDDEIKIILQHQFWDLNTDEEKFSVILSFNGKKKKIVVPYKSIFSFSDPSVGFGLQFKNNVQIPKSEKKETEIVSSETLKEIQSFDNEQAEVVSLDAFRTKNLD